VEDASGLMEPMPTWKVEELARRRLRTIARSQRISGEYKSQNLG